MLYRSFGGDSELVSDWSQETFLRMLRYAPFEDLQDPAEFRAYLTSVAKNVARTSFKRRSTAGRLEREFHAAELETVDAWGTAQATEELLELEDLFERALGRLPDEDRQLLRLLAEDRSLSEIAARLGITYQNAGVRVHRLREKLRDDPDLRDLVSGRE
jgi:RNA polymerase sigma factor (sigma-70 family)